MEGALQPSRGEPGRSPGVLAGVDLVAWVRRAGLAGLLTACAPSSVTPGALPPGGLDYVQSVAWGSVGHYQEQYDRHAGKSTPYADIDWFRNGCASHLTLGHGLAFSPACHQHDFGYRNLRQHDATRTVAHRRRTDEVFYANMRAICAVQPPERRPACAVEAWIYYHTVRLFGGPFFWGRR